MGRGLEKLAGDPQGNGFKARDLWRIHTELNLLVQSQGRGVSARLARGMPRVLRDSGLVLLALLGLGIGYRKYRDYPVNLWSTEVSLMNMQVDQVSQGYGELQINKTVEKVPVMVDGTFYPEAFGTHAESRIDVSLLKAGAKLSGACGYPDSAHGGAIICTIEIGSHELYRSEVLSDKARLSQFQVPIAGVQKLTLHVVSAQPGINAAHAVWVDFKVHDD